MEALDSARSIWLSNETDSPVRRASCLSVSSCDLRASRMVRPMARFYDALGRALHAAGVADGQQRIAEHIRARRLPSEELVALTRAAGFEVEDASLHGFQWRFASAEALFRHHFIRLGFLEPWRALVPDEARPEVFRTLLERLDADALQLEIPFACISARRT